MDFSLSEAQTEIAGLARKILVERDSPERQWADLAAAGVLAAGLPESLGGAGLGFLEQCSVLAEAGRAASPVPYLPSIVLGAGAIAAFGTPDQQRRWAAPAGEGSLLITAALAEEDSDDPASPSAVAERAGDGWRLSGVKTAVPAAMQADLVLVPATVTTDGRGPYVLTFLVQPADRGVTVQPQELTGTGNDAGEAGAGRLVLDGAVLDDSRVLGEPGAAGDVAGWLVARYVVGLCATQAGVVARALELTAEYARAREQFGRPIGSFQAVAQRLADAYVDVEAAWLTMWQAAWLLAVGRRPTRRSPPRSPPPSSGPPTRATGSRIPPSTCTAGWASTRRTPCTGTSPRLSGPSSPLAVPRPNSTASATSSRPRGPA